MRSTIESVRFTGPQYGPQSSELEDEPSPGTARLEDPVGRGGFLRREGPGHSERHLTFFPLLTQTVELGLLAGVVAHRYRMKGHASLLLTFETPNGSDAAAVAHGPGDELVEQ